ncbi:TetR/AcrR family transcriptional regulator [Rhodococcus rhodochrous]|uniref:TetR family transcriptional regulator n=1 Tax=Rhodococcus rhodochrous TaxID=1829 RepID=A0AA47ACB7_RHORH|nr:TetR family transcriptional regulator [Rhodococcus rhodochrous]UZF45847.1 TetR family transcriptional regulator [Rhodococcus rhodochrous]
MSIAATPKGERRRQALVEAAADLILEGGIDAVRHRAVATRAGLPLASTTYYFESLDDLVACAVDYNSERELDAMRERVRDIEPLPRSLEGTADLIVELLIGPRDCDGGIDRERLISRYERCVATARYPELRDVQVRMREQIDHLLTDLLERCCRSVRPREVRRLVAVVDGAVLGGLGELDPDPRSLARGILLDVVETVAPPIED